MSDRKINQILCGPWRAGKPRNGHLRHRFGAEKRRQAAFFHALDAEFLNHATIGPLSVVYQELEEMGKFAILILVDRAQRRGVAEVNYAVREGNIRKQLRLILVPEAPE